MPGRRSHGGLSSKQPKIRANNKKRSLNAFAIAAQQNPESITVRQHRLGHIEGDDRPAKRVKTEDNSWNDGDGSSAKQQKEKVKRGRFDELDIDAGSDSDGNEWRMGHVDSDDDSDLDSDEAFGDSDEEKFEGFTFSGSSTLDKIRKSKKGAPSQDISLGEEDMASEMDLNSEDESLGDDAIDLAAMLDATEEDSEENVTNSRERRTGNADESEVEGSGSESESEESDDISFGSSMEESDEDDTEKITALQNLIASLPQAESSKAIVQQRSDGASEYNIPSDFGIVSRAKLTLEDLELPSIRDPFFKKSLKLIASESMGDSPGRRRSGKLEVPLAKRQQDRLDRGAAYEKSKEALDRWTDTVKHNRRAEHLTFPLPDIDAAAANSNARLQPTTASKPFNELEATIQKILEESGLATTSGKDEDDKLAEFEGLEMNKMSLEEVKSRQAQLRMARDLLFREEARAKRIKKIKSKSYRKVHRKQREKENQMNRQALIEAGVEPSEDEQELQDRLRAEERMGAKHRDSKWAKATKQAGRAVWDVEARAGINEMARRDDELRKRIEGRPSRKDSSEVSGSSDSESDGEEAGQALLLRKLEDVGTSPVQLDSGSGSKLSNMKFMVKAEASRKKQNDATVEQIRKDLTGEHSSENDENDITEVGRRSFGPGIIQVKGNDISPAHKSNEFEEPEDSGYEDDVRIQTTSRGEVASSRNAPNMNHRRLTSLYEAPQAAKLDIPATEVGGGAWSRKLSQKDMSESRRRKQKLDSAAGIEELDISNVAVIAKPVRAKKMREVKQAILEVDNSGDDSGDGDASLHLPFAIRDQELIKRAFAGADVVGEFEAEKRQTIMDEDEQTIDNTLPGWGNWVGDGVSKKDKRQHKGRFLTISEGVKEQHRRDSKLERVIINEKRVKKNGKYLASNLPHPFETRQQYERSLRLPVGPEWATKETFQDATKPRILIKQGIVAPMSKPLF